MVTGALGLPGLIDDDDRIRDLSEHLSSQTSEYLDPDRPRRGRPARSRVAPTGGPKACGCASPCRRIGKIVGVGPNYHDAAGQAGFKVNPEPTLFLKAATAACGPNDRIELPKLATRVDWGVELAVVIGRTAKYVSVEEAMRHVAGFTLANDITERSFQLQRGGQWSKGKSHDTFAPLGPWLVTPDAIGDHDAIDLWLDVNGERQQSASTAGMIFKVPYLISYISRFMRLEPGDIILTGTPGGVGLSYDPPRFLKAGDRITFGGTGLGVQEMECVAL